jgi:hypothetical protein
LHGGCVGAVVHATASLHFATTLSAQNQPDILVLHLEFLRSGILANFHITVTDLKLGIGTSTIQLNVFQRGQLKLVALATSTNFDKSVGPTAQTDWTLHPKPDPRPSFERILAQKSDGNWLAHNLSGEILPFTSRQITLYPRNGFPSAGVCDMWYTFTDDERMDSTYLTLMTDCIPSLSDTLLRNEGLYDAHKTFAASAKWDVANPGVPVQLTNSLNEAANAMLFNSTVTLDIEFKKRLPRDGLKWLFTRAATKVLNGGRMDLDVTLCDDQMEMVCQARQVILALEAKRRFKDGKRITSSL